MTRLVSLDEYPGRSHYPAVSVAHTGDVARFVQHDRAEFLELVVLTGVDPDPAISRPCPSVSLG